MNANTLRLFIAIELPAEVKAGLAGIQEDLKNTGVAIARWVSPEALHLTLKFLGYVGEDVVPQLATAMESAVRGIAPFRLSTGGLGFFPNPRRPRVLWIGLAGDLDSLAYLQEATESAVSGLGFSRENRPFDPHLTLARMTDEASPQRKQAFADEALQLKPPTWSFTVEAVDLMRSTLKPPGAVYDRLARVQLRA